MTESRAPRQNSDGDRCPEWCVTDHSAPFSPVHVSHPARAGRHAWACAVRNDEGLCIGVHGHDGGPWARLDLSPEDAEQLALLAAMTGASDLAAAIRQAAACITDATGGQR